MQNGILIALVIFLLVLNGVMLWRLSHRPKDNEKDETAFKLLFQQMNELARTVDQKIGETTKEVSSAIRHQFGESASHLFRRPTPKSARYFKKSKTTRDFRRILFGNPPKECPAAQFLPDAISLSGRHDSGCGRICERQNYSH